MDLVGFTAEPSAPKDVRSEGDCCAVREWVCPALPLHLTLRPLCRVETTPAATFGRAEAADWGTALYHVCDISLYRATSPQSLRLPRAPTRPGLPRSRWPDDQSGRTEGTPVTPSLGQPSPRGGHCQARRETPLFLPATVKYPSLGPLRTGGGQSSRTGAHARLDHQTPAVLAGAPRRSSLRPCGRRDHLPRHGDESCDDHRLCCCTWTRHLCRSVHVNDPSAGSPTETLLRLLLPLNDQVWTSFRQALGRPDDGVDRTRSAAASPKASLNHSIGSSDGRCVQRAGT